MYNEQTEASEHDDCQLLPISNKAVLLSSPVIVDQVFASEHKPEYHEGRIENPLLDVIEQGQPRHVKTVER